MTHQKSNVDLMTFDEVLRVFTENLVHLSLLSSESLQFSNLLIVLHSSVRKVDLKRLKVAKFKVLSIFFLSSTKHKEQFHKHILLKHAGKVLSHA